MLTSKTRGIGRRVVMVKWFPGRACRFSLNCVICTKLAYNRLVLLGVDCPENLAALRLFFQNTVDTPLLPARPALPLKCSLPPLGSHNFCCDFSSGSFQYWLLLADENIRLSFHLLRIGKEVSDLIAICSFRNNRSWELSQVHSQFLASSSPSYV